MSVDYTAVIGVGVDYEDVTYETLTIEGKNVVLDIFKGSDQYLMMVDDYITTLEHEPDFVTFSDIPQEIVDRHLYDFWYDYLYEYDILYELGLNAETGSYFSGDMCDLGVRVALDIKVMAEQVEIAKQTFKKVINLEPELFMGVLVS